MQRPMNTSAQQIGSRIVPVTTIQEFIDGRIITYTVHPMSDGGGMATHEGHHRSARR